MFFFFAEPVVVEKNTELTMMNGVPSTSVTSGAASNNLRLYGIAGGAVGGTVLLAGIILALVLCKKRRGDFHCLLRYIFC